RKMAETLDGFESDISNIYMQRFTGTKDELAELLAEETWINAQDALAYGLIDEIVEPVKAAASLNITDFKNAPEAVQQLFGQPPASPATQQGVTTMPKATNAAAPTGADPINPADPAGNTPEPQAVATTAADVQAAVDAALAARSQTNTQIQVPATPVRLSADETAAIVAQNLSLDKAREAILAVVAKRDQENQPVPHVIVSNNTSVLRQDVAKGLMAKAGLIDRKEGNDFTMMSLVDIARVVLQASGISV